MWHPISNNSICATKNTHTYIHNICDIIFIIITHFVCPELDIFLFVHHLEISVYMGKRKDVLNKMIEIDVLIKTNRNTQQTTFKLLTIVQFDDLSQPHRLSA